MFGLSKKEAAEAERITALLEVAIGKAGKAGQDWADAVHAVGVEYPIAHRMPFLAGSLAIAEKYRRKSTTKKDT